MSEKGSSNSLLKDVANLITGIREERDFTTKELNPLPKFIPSTCTVN